MKYLLLILAIFFSNAIFSQNLLPNGSFESTQDFNYLDPPDAFSYLEAWYPASYRVVDPTYPGTPDLFDSNHPWPPSSPPNFWNIFYDTFAGSHFVGIANHMTYTGYTQPEAVCSPLTVPLETNEYYHIELQTRNKGATGYNGADPIFCVSENYEFINILVGPDSIFVAIDEDNNDSYTNASKTIPLYSEKLETKLAGTWHRLGTCFQANGDEKYLGITTGLGKFSVNQPCIIYDEHWDVFYVFYFDIDDIKLTKLPKQIDLDTAICEGKKTRINIEDMAGLPIMQNQIEFSWGDGSVDSVNFISEAGTYYIDAKTDCNSIPIILEVSELKCIPDIYVPNAFSPNGDGINDDINAFFYSDMEVINFQFSILSRWGEIVFSTDDTSEKWDGTFNGEEMGQETYTWLLKYTINDIENGLVDYSESGDFILFR